MTFKTITIDIDAYNLLTSEKMPKPGSYRV